MIKTFAEFTHGDVLRYAHALTRQEPSAERYAKRLGRNMAKVYAKVREALRESLRALKESHKLSAAAVLSVATLGYLVLLSFSDALTAAALGALTVSIMVGIMYRLKVLIAVDKLNTPSSRPHHLNVTLKDSYRPLLAK